MLDMVIVYLDMDKGENLEHYFRNLESLGFIIIFLIPSK